MRDELVTRAETAVLETGLDPSSWPDVLSDIAESTGAFGAVVLPMRGRVPGVPVTRNFIEVIDTYFRDGWAARDRRELSFPKLLKTGVAVEQDFVTASEMDRDPYWQDFLGRFDLRWSCILRISAADDIWCLAIQRTIRQGLFTDSEQRNLARLIAPLSRAATFVRRLGETRLTDVTDALDAFGCAGVLLTRTGQVARMNQRAQALLGGEINFVRGELSCPDPQAAKALRRHIEAALWADVSPNSPALMPVLLPRPGRRPLILQAQLLRGEIRSCFAPATVLLLITDPDEELIPSTAVLRLLFGFTDAEARLARCLAETFGLQTAAAGLGISYSTARTQLQAVFAKSGTTTQAELVALLTRTARVRPR